MGTILVKGGRVWDGERFFFADILTEGKVIAKIGENITDNADFIFDATGKTVSAGLVDIHTHLRGVSSKEFGTQGEASCFPFGVTAVSDASGVLGDNTLLDSFSLKNVVFVCAEFKNNKAYFTEAEKMLKKYGKKAIGIKVYFDTAGAPVYDITPLKEVCGYARAKNLKVMVHCSDSPTSMADIVRTLSAGDILTHIYHGGVNPCTENDFEAFRIAKDKGIILDTGFAGYVHTDFAVLKAAVEGRALPDTISTDITKLSAFKRGGRYGMTMCMSIAREAGMDEADIFRAVTSSAAKAVGKEEEWGYLKEGRNADIAVFDLADEGFDLTDKAGNNIKSANGFRCLLTISDGEVVYRR